MTSPAKLNVALVQQSNSNNAEQNMANQLPEFAMQPSKAHS